MKIKPKQYAQSLFEAVKNKKTSELKAVIDNFTKVLIDNNQISQLGKILNFFEGMWNEEFSLVAAEIKSAKKLDNDMVKLLSDYIIKLANAKEVKIKETVDKKLLGGFVVKYGDKIMDGSLRVKLVGLKEEMRK